MELGYVGRASWTVLSHPAEGAERIRGRFDRRRDMRELAASGGPRAERYPVAGDWAPVLHEAVGAPWPCGESEHFGKVWDATVADLATAGLRVGRASYGGWNDGDRAQAEAIWCLIAHSHPVTVVETGVAHGLTSRVILEGLNRHGQGHLWSIDLPAVDPALHHEIGVAVPDDLRSRWTYIEGTSRGRLPGLLRTLPRVDLFVHDSLHTARNMCFELDTVWPALPPDGIAVVDDIDHSLGFRHFVDQVAPQAWVAARHANEIGLWAVAVKAESSEAPSASGPRRPAGAAQEVRVSRHQKIEESVVAEIARLVTSQAQDKRRLLQIQPGSGGQSLIVLDQLAAGSRAIIYDDVDKRDPDVRARTDFSQVDIEAPPFPAANGDFDLVVWNRELVTVKNIGPALKEVRRVLRPGGVFVLAVPNLAALHNRLLLMTGRQPSTLHIGNGDHVRGFAFHSMTEFLTRDLGFELLQVAGVGLAPVTAAVLPGPLRGLSHTGVWALRRI